MPNDKAKTTGERLVCLETKVDTMIDTQTKTTEKLDQFIEIVNKLLPTYVTKQEMNEHSIDTEKRIENLKKANKLQSILTNILVGALSVILTALIMFWFNNK